LAGLLYTTKGGLINSVSPGVFFLYDGVHLVSGDITITEDTGLWSRVIPVNGTQVILYDLNCNIVRNYSNDPAGLIISSDGKTVTLNGVIVPPGDYILSVKYDPSALIGFNPSPPSNTYTFTVKAGAVSSGSTSLLVSKKPNGKP
jgi:hypothetical protein